MECCGKDRNSKFCPECGKKVPDHPLKQLREYLQGKIAGHKKSIHEASVLPAEPPAGVKEKIGRKVEYHKGRLAFYTAALEALIKVTPAGI